MSLKKFEFSEATSTIVAGEEFVRFRIRSFRNLDMLSLPRPVAILIGLMISTLDLTLGSFCMVLSGSSVSENCGEIADLSLVLLGDVLENSERPSMLEMSLKNYGQ